MIDKAKKRVIAWATSDKTKHHAGVLAKLLGKAAGDLAFLGCAFVALLGVWHWSPSLALVLAGVAGMAYVVLFGGKRP